MWIVARHISVLGVLQCIVGSVGAFNRRILLPFAVSVFGLLLVVEAGAQAVTYPPLADGVTECNGSRIVRFQRDPAQSAKMWVRVIVWKGTDLDVHNYFQLLRNNGAGFVRLEPGDEAILFENQLRGAYTEIAANPKWKEILIELPATFPKGVDFELVNKRNVFHFGVAYSDTPPTSFDYLTNSAPLPRVVEIRYESGGAFVPVVSKQVNVCRGGKIKFYTGLGPDDIFEYAWSPGSGIVPPLDSSVVEIRNIIANTTYVVTRKGICDFQDNEEVSVKVDEPIKPTLSAVEHRCGGGDVFLSATDLDHATEVTWQWHKDGAPDGLYVDLATAPVVGNVANYNANLPYERVGSHTYGDPVHHTVQLLARNGNCVARVARQVTIYPDVPLPVISKYQPLPGDCSPVVCRFSAANKNDFPKDTKYTWEFFEQDGATNLSLGVRRDEQAPFRFEWEGPGVRKFKVHLTIKDKSEKCSKVSEEVIAVKPRIQAGFTVEMDPAGGCSPVNITLKSTSVGQVSTYEWRYINGARDELWGVSKEVKKVAFSADDDAQSEIVLKVKNVEGCESKLSSPLQVYSAPKADPLDAQFTGNEKCSPVKVALSTKNILRAVRYEWRIKKDAADVGQPHGEGGALPPTQTTLSSEFTFSNSTTTAYKRIVQLRLYSDKGCATVLEREITVPGRIEPYFSVGDVNGCPKRDGIREVILKNTTAAPVGAVSSWFIDGVTVVPAVSGTEVKLNLQNLDIANSVTQRVKLKVAYDGCEREYDADFTTYPRVNPAFRAMVDAGGSPVEWNVADKRCAPIDVKFEGSGGNSLKWDLSSSVGSRQGEGNKWQIKLSNLTPNEVVHTVRLTAFNSYHCSDYVEKQYIVLPSVSAAFDVEILDACTPYRIKLLDKTSSGVAHTAQWDVGDGVETPVGSGIYEFSIPGVKTIKLKSKSGSCVNEAAPYSFEVLEPIQVALGAVAPAAKVCAPATLTFDNFSSGVTKLTWFFEGSDGESEVINAPTASHIYQNKGEVPVQYDVLVVGENARGCGGKPGSKSVVPVTIYPEPQPGKIYRKKESCNPVSLTVETTSKGLTDFKWEFRPQGTIASYGDLVEKTGKQTVGKIPVSLENRHVNSILEYKAYYSGSQQWLGGPTCTTGPTEIEVIKVPPKLKINISPAPSEICSGAEVLFEDKSFGGAIEHNWNFGDDGETAVTQRGIPQRHTFLNTSESDKVYTVEVLSYQKEYGCSAKSMIPILVHPEVKAIFSQSTSVDKKCEYPLPVTFVNSSTGHEQVAGVTTLYDWDYGYKWDGIDQKETRTDKGSHVYQFYNSNPNTNSTYTVTLTAKQRYTSGKECSGQQSHEVITPPLLAPRFTIDNPEGCIPHTVTLSNVSMGGNNLECVWDFGDAGQQETTVGNARQVVHTYNNVANVIPVDYVITMTAKNALGCEAKSTQIVTTYPKVTAGLNLSGTEFCSPATLVVENASRNAKEYVWTISGPGAPTLPNTTTLDPITIPLDNTTANSIHEYTLKLQAKAVYGTHTCEDVAERNYSVLPRVVAKFKVNPVTIGCNPLNITVENKSSGADSYEWFTGDELIANVQQPEFKPFENFSREENKEYELKLVAKNKLDCFAEDRVTLTVLPLVEAQFTLTKRAGCTPFITQAEVEPNRQSPAYSYLWEIDEGVATTPKLATTGDIVFKNLTKAPPRIIEGKVRLTTRLEKASECFETHEETVQIYPGVYPAFSGNLESCTPFKAQFKNTSDVFNEPEAKYKWDFGNGVTVQAREPENMFINTSYVDDASYLVTLTATSEHGCEDSLTKKVTIHPKPKSVFAIEGSSESCPPFDVTLQNLSEGVNLTYKFDFGDGSLKTLTERDPVSHRYDNNSNEELGYTIALTATTEYNCKDETSQPVRVFPQTVADFIFDPGNAACAPFLVEMQNRASGADKFSWQFGDGKSSDMFEPAHTFENTSRKDTTYNVTLSVVSPFNCSATLTKPLTVYATPKAKFSVTPPLQVFPNATISLVNNTTPKDGDFAYKWSFGDGVTTDERDPGSHTYARWAPKAWNSAFPVTLYAQNDKCKDSLVTNVYVYAPLPKTIFETDSFEGCTPMTIFFRNDTEFATNFLWDFGDSTTSTEREPIHTYERPGTYNVKLTATGDGGTTFFYAVYTAHSNPVAKFSIIPNKVMIPKARVKAQDESTDAVVFFWDFGDGYTTSEESPVHDYQSPGEYAVKLKVKSEAGCEDETELATAVLVLPAGKILFPNVFQPNEYGANGGLYDIHDTKNEVFHPVAEGVVEYQLSIFNRWGETLFESNDIEIGWDGYRDGRLCETGVYAWRAVGRFYNGEIFDLRGNVTLLR